MLFICWALHIPPLDNKQWLRDLGIFDRKYLLIHCDLSAKERTNCTLNHMLPTGLIKLLSDLPGHEEWSANNVVKIKIVGLDCTEIDTKSPDLC